MNNLTQEQIETLEYSFANLNLNLESLSNLLTVSMEGIQQQLDSGADRIFYSYRNETGGVTITFMKVGEETEESRIALNKVRKSVRKDWKELKNNVRKYD